MRKKIFTDAFLLGISILLICAGLFFALQYKQTMDETYDALKGEAVYAAAGLEIGGWHYLGGIKSTDCVTWIAADGTVLYDSSSPELNNQKDCPEVRDALTDGEGYGVRSSDSTGASTMYCPGCTDCGEPYSLGCSAGPADLRGHGVSTGRSDSPAGERAQY